MSKWIQFTDTMINLDQVIMVTKRERRADVVSDGKVCSITFWFNAHESISGAGGTPYTVEEDWPDEKSRDLALADIHEAAGVAFDLDRHVGE